MRSYYTRRANPGRQEYRLFPPGWPSHTTASRSRCHPPSLLSIIQPVAESRCLVTKPAILDSNEVSTLLGLSPNSIAKKVKQSEFLQPVRLGKSNSRAAAVKWL